jgi:ABC-2 type transport system ATP-binding protein
MALNVTKVVKKFGDLTAVDCASFTMDSPGVFGLLGTNGAGKTTMIRMILGILQKDAGDIRWDGQPVTRETVNFGYLPEERGIYPKAKVREQLMYFARLRGMDNASARTSLTYWLERLHVEEYADTVAEKLSKGNQQKIQVISSLIHNPELVILDEPFSGLDPVNTDILKQVISDLIQEGKYIIMSTHQMSTVEEFCNQILILHAGKTVLAGDLKQIKHGYGRTNLSIECNNDIDSLARAEGLSTLQKTANGYEFKITSDDQAYRLLRRIMASDVRLDKFEIREPSLHEIFVDKVGVKS